MLNGGDVQSHVQSQDSRSLCPCFGHLTPDAGRDNRTTALLVVAMHL